MPFDVPQTLGPFQVARDGRLSPISAGRFPSFSVTWMGRQIWATMTDPDGSRLTLSLVAGRVPSTAGTKDDQRGDALRTLSHLPALLPRDWTARLYADHRVMLTTEITLAMPATITELVTTLTQFLLTLGPYLELLDGTGLASARAGVAKT